MTAAGIGHEELCKVFSTGCGVGWQSYVNRREDEDIENQDAMGRASAVAVFPREAAIS